MKTPLSSRYIRNFCNIQAVKKPMTSFKLIPLGELAPGVVLSQIEYRRKKYAILSKSGGFGSDRLLLDLKEKLSLQKLEEEEVC